ncbi:hypothetical protein FHT87_005149 [Rhizobium sp. BK316]|uniref:hypothetical protein n=1 Tax=Rhizobium sp. BK316 TaxID=2587053 RepID=UPI001610A1CA|nr:hypothetical protein [Rhizobium sp. BK316]MBB3411196.1 hypothetical protein [Rhizobium sp. BK316]
MAKSRLCSIPDCGKPHYGRGLCNKHWQRLRKYGDPHISKTTPGDPEKYLYDVVLSYNGDECLIWPFGRVSTGYGLVRIDGKSALVSRFVCEKICGPAPSITHEAAHSCGKGHLGCATKRHLSWKTPTENKADQLIHGTRARGTKHGNAKLTEAAVETIRSLCGKAKQAEIAQRFGVDQSVISRVQSGKRWAWLG